MSSAVPPQSDGGDERPYDPFGDDDVFYRNLAEKYVHPGVPQDDTVEEGRTLGVPEGNKDASIVESSQENESSLSNMPSSLLDDEEFFHSLAQKMSEPQDGDLLDEVVSVPNYSLPVTDESFSSFSDGTKSFVDVDGLTETGSANDTVEMVRETKVVSGEEVSVDGGPGVVEWLEQDDLVAVNAGVADDVAVPNVVGLPVETATEILSGMGFDYAVEIVDQDWLRAVGDVEDANAPGTIMWQNPGVGDPLPENMVIALRQVEATGNVSTETGKTKFNKWALLGIVGTVLVAALAVLLVAMSFLSNKGDDGGKNAVPVPTSPAPSSPSASPTAEPVPVTVPNLVGLSFDKGTTVATKAGFTVEEETRVVSSKPMGMILSQTPTAKKTADRGSAILVRVSGGTKGSPAPKVTSINENEAKQKIQAAGFVVGKVTVVANPAPQGTVLSQTPTAGTKLPPGASIGLTVSDGKLEMPNVIGKTKEQAVSDLVALGYTVNVYQLEAPGKPANTVFKQDPAAGTTTDTGAQISITVTPPN